MQYFGELLLLWEVVTHFKSLKPLQAESIQILYICGNHWIGVSTVNCTTEDITVYDSKYSRLSSDTETLLVQFFRLWIVCCGTHLTIAFGLNPCLCVFQQSAMREHLRKCLGDKKMQPFPYRRKGDWNDKFLFLDNCSWRQLADVSTRCSSPPLGV